MISIDGFGYHSLRHSPPFVIACTTDGTPSRENASKSLKSRWTVNGNETNKAIYPRNSVIGSPLRDDPLESKSYRLPSAPDNQRDEGRLPSLLNMNVEHLGPPPADIDDALNQG